jgi:hypothetical protein
MDDHVLDAMRARARDVRTRDAIRRWQYRQRNLAAGVWFRLRRALADAKAAYVISDEDARRLVAEGYPIERCGRELTPEKTIVFVEETRVTDLASRRPIPVGLGPDFLTATAVALVRFDV